jgi:AAA domain
MRLTRVDLPGFGCLSGFSCEPGSGFNLFYGDNEAGKSTLQGAICAMLYGFYENDRARPDETARHDRYRPWAGGAYRGSLEYELEDGRRFEVRRDFSTQDVITQVIDTNMGTDVTAQFGRGRHGNVPFARKHIGMSRSVFQSCAFITQGEIFEVEKTAPTQIGDAIAALADSARRDVSAVRALERLEAALSKVGSDRARTADLPVAREKLARARADLAAADEARGSVSEKAQRLDEARERAAELADDCVRTEYLLHRSQAARLRSVLKQIADADAAMAEASAAVQRHDSATGISATLREEVIGLRGRLDRARDAATRTEQELAEVRGHVSDEERLEYEALRVSVGRLSDDQIAELQSVAYGSAQAERRSLIGGIVDAIRRVVAGIARWFGRVIKRGSDQAAHAEQASKGAREQAVTASADEAIVLLERHRRYLTLRPLVERLEAANRQMEAERSSMASLEAQVLATVGTAGVEAASSAEALEAFDEAWRASEELRLAEEVLAEAQRRRELILDGRTAEERETYLQQREAAMARMFGARPDLAGCESGRSSEQLRTDLDDLTKRQHATDLEAKSLEEEVRLKLESCRPRAEIEEEIAEHEGEVRRLEKARAAIMLARETIQEAMTNVYRDFAPAVNSFLSEGIEVATDGRYKRAHVDPSALKVSLLVPETGQVITDPPVSHGTRTLMYVLMRIGLAQHMSAIGEPVPLVLDDPFVDVDARRLQRMLWFLLQLSERMQVLLFTKDRTVLDWFEANAGAPAHQIHELSGGIPATL